MTTLTTPFPTRTPVSVILSVAIHGALIAGILYASFHQVIEVPKASQPISVSMVAPEVQPEPAPAEVTPPPPEPEPEPEVAPEPPKVEPVPIPKPEPKPKPKPKPKVEKKPEPKPRQEVKPQPVKQEETTTQTRPSTAPKSVPNAAPKGADGPKAVNVSKPIYPARAQALRVEGNVRVRFDVDSDGRVDNIEVLSANPRNMFERDVRNAMKKWRYLPNRPGKGLTMNIVFRMNGGSSIE